MTAAATAEPQESGVKVPWSVAVTATDGPSIGALVVLEMTTVAGAGASPSMSSRSRTIG